MQDPVHRYSDESPLTAAVDGVATAVAPASESDRIAVLKEAGSAGNQINSAKDERPTAEDGVRSAEPRIRSAERTDHIDGVFDGIDGRTVRGWASDEDDEDLQVGVEVLANHRWVASGRADLFREDLLEAGKGDGHHSFCIQLPAYLCDGGIYEIAVRAGKNGDLLSPGVRIFQHKFNHFGHLDGLDGPFVVGWVRNPLSNEGCIRLELLIDSQAVLTGEAAQPAADGLRFSLRIPQRFYDGRPHVITVQTIEPFHLVGEIVAIVPATMTPVDALRRYSGSFSNAALLDGAAARYEGLRRNLATLASDANILGAAETIDRLKQVAAAHELVIAGFDAPEKSFADLPPLKFPPADAPMVSVVVPVHNKVRVTYNCLASLLFAPNRARFEVIVVDDGSSDETLKLRDRVHGVEFLRHETSLGFIRSCNDGAQAARGTHVVMLNNDTEVTAGWIDELLHVFDHFENVGMAGAKLLYSNGRLQEAGGIVWNNGDPWNYGRDGNARDPRYNYTRQVDYMSGACLMLPKRLWDELRGFDERFSPAYFEDTDLAFRVRERGLKTVYTPFAQVIHFEGLSNGTQLTTGIKRYQETNRPKFKARWSRAFKGNGNVGRDVDLNKDRNLRFRALMIDYTTPNQDRDAGGYAALQEIRLLQSLGFKVTFMPDNLAYLGGPTETLQRMGVECIYAPFVASVKELLETRGAEFDLVYLIRYEVANHHIESVRRFAPQAKVILNNADLHFLRELRVALAANREKELEVALRTRDNELALMRKVDLVLSYSDVERSVIISHNLNATRVARCPWIVRLPEGTAGFEERRDIAFLGSFSHLPNADAMEYFVLEVMPHLRTRLPDVALRIYGSNIDDRIRALAAPDVIIEGWVPVVDEVYEDCRVFIAPLRSGAGIKGKVIGAFAYGAPCVLSPLAAEGIGIRSGQDALIADTPAEWVESIASLYENRSRWLSVRDAARQFAATEFSFANGQKLMQAALETVDIYATPDESTLTHDGSIR
jgi:GT2 family glycosyltransferase/glycosyltransferase involved in cell wall biosynthesis